MKITEEQVERLLEVLTSQIDYAQVTLKWGCTEYARGYLNGLTDASRAALSAVSREEPPVDTKR